MLSIGILGAGNISNTHMQAAMEADGVKVDAVCGQNRKKVEKLCETSGATAYSDLNDFLSHKTLDIVAIGSPSGVHADQGIRAAEKGLHVLVEKPIDVNVKQADRLIEACRKAGVRVGVFFQDRVSDGPVALKKLLAEGKLGQPSLATAHVKWYRPPDYYSDSKWRGTWALDGGGAMMNQGIHTLDLLNWLMGDVRQVFAYAKTQMHSIETEDTLVACLDFTSGVIATYEATTAASPGQPRRLIVSGSGGSAVIEHDQLVSVDLVSGEKVLGSSVTEDRALSESSAVVSDVNGHRKLIEDFVGAIKQNRDPACSGLEGRKSVALAEAIYKSAKTGRPVNL